MFIKGPPDFDAFSRGSIFNFRRTTFLKISVGPTARPEAGPWLRTAAALPLHGTAEPIIPKGENPESVFCAKCLKSTFIRG